MSCLRTIEGSVGRTDGLIQNTLRAFALYQGKSQAPLHWPPLSDNRKISNLDKSDFQPPLRDSKASLPRRD
jgi:hypothetical protein